jgi:hypothetical protein
MRPGLAALDSFRWQAWDRHGQVVQQGVEMRAVPSGATPVQWAEGTAMSSSTGPSYHTGLWECAGELVLTVRASLAMDSFDPRQLRIRAWVESSTGGPDRHFSRHALTGTTRNLVAVWSSEDDGIPLSDGDRLHIVSAPEGLDHVQVLARHAAQRFR